MAGPLAGTRIVELQGRGPGPFGAMLLADLGADVVRIVRPADVEPALPGEPAGPPGPDGGGSPGGNAGLDRPPADVDPFRRAPGASGPAGGGDAGVDRMIAGRRRIDLLARGRRSVAVDLKHPDGVAAALRLIDGADVLVEGFRPGVTERLGLGPDVCRGRNAGLVYARITGWGQDGPYAPTPGHDLNYVALAGALDPLRRSPGEAPAPPLNLLGDFGGGGMLLAVGVLSALVERGRSGVGQVVDAAMVDGVALLTTLFHGMRAEGLWSDVPGTNVLDLGAPFYNVYGTADGGHVTVACGEPEFYAELVDRLGLDRDLLRRQNEPAAWPADRDELAAAFRSRTRAEWCELLEGTDTCFAPVLSMAEAPTHAHVAGRGTFVERGGVVQPAAAPRFSRTPGTAGAPPVDAGRHTVDVLREAGLATGEIDALLAAGVVRQAAP